MKQIFTIAISLIIMCWVTSCVNVSPDEKQSTQVSSIGKATTMKQFVDINVVGAMQVFYSLGNNHTVRVEAQRETFEKLVIYVKENELYISSKNENFGLDSLSMMNDVKVYVTSPSLHVVQMTGEGAFTASSPVDVSLLDVKLTGSGCVTFKKKVDASKGLDVELIGSGIINIADLSSAKLKTQVTGSGSVNYENINVDDADSRITGSGSINMRGAIAEHARTITGSGKINVTHLN